MARRTGAVVPASVMRAVVRRFVRPVLGPDVSVRRQRRRVNALMKVARLPRGTRVDQVVLGGQPPEHPYPAALDDAEAAYRALVGRGIDPRRIAVAGDSAGGGLSLALMIRLRAAGAPLPGAVALISPWTDLTLDGVRDDPRDPMLRPAWRATPRPPICGRRSCRPRMWCTCTPGSSRPPPRRSARSASSCARPPPQPHRWRLRCPLTTAPCCPAPGCPPR